MAEHENADFSSENHSKGKKFSAESIKKIVLFAGVAGIALIFLSNFQFGNHKETTEEVKVDETSMVEEYRLRLSEEMGNMLAGIEGVGKTKIMITLDQTTQTVYATEEDNQSKTEGSNTQTSLNKNYVIIREENGGENGLTITTILPKVKGVLVVCEGGGKEEVRESVINAVSAALGISSSRICVSKLSS